MTQNGDPYENALAERVNGILKNEFNMAVNAGTIAQLNNKLAKIIRAYNGLRPHDSCNGLTPDQAHQQSGELTKKWKNYKRKKWDLKIEN